MKKNLIFFSSIFFYLSIGIILSVNTGISHDETHEQNQWIVNFEAYKSLFGLGDYTPLINFEDRYHGIGFHFFSQPLQHLLYKIVANINGTTDYGSFLLSRHISIFLLFFFSGIFFYRINKILSLSKPFSRASTIIYLTFPYLFGHSLINPKDIPFLSIWLITTYYLIKILKFIYDDRKILIKTILKLAFFSSFLLSIRIVGLLIFLEFLIGFLVLLNFKKVNLLLLIKENIKKIIYFLIVFLSFLYIFNPIFWHNPFEIINSINHLSKYFFDVCTLTLGKCESALNLPASYYFIWLFFKLPIISLLGLCLYPLIEKKFLKGGFRTVILLTLTFTVIFIILLFILKKIHIYDEIRHILFLVPLILIVTFYNIYLFKKEIFYFFSLITVVFFLIDNFKLYPYQYTWLNEFSRIYDINKNFEVDYWGISNTGLQKKIIKYYNKKKFNNDICVYGDAYTSTYLTKLDFNCQGHYGEIDAVKVRPFIAYQNLRNLKRNPPYNCDLLEEEKYNYIFSDQNIIVGKLWYCY